MAAAPTGPADPALARFLAEELGAAPAAGDAPAWQITAPVWLWRGNHADGTPTKAAWYFITIDGPVGAAIRAAVSGRTGGFGSARINATIGATTWTTSLFPHRESGGYILPLKAPVRKAEKLDVGTAAALTLRLN